MTRLPSTDTPVVDWNLRQPLRVLLLEHDADDAELNLHELRKAGFTLQPQIAGNREEFARALEQGQFDVALADYRVPGWNGLEGLKLLREKGWDFPFILVTGTLGEELAVECIRQGVTDYVLKGNLARLPVTVHRALEEKALRDARSVMVEALRQSETGFRFLFENNPLAMWVFDRETLQFLQVNDAAVSRYGYPREEFLRMRLTDIRPPAEVPNLLAALEKPHWPFWEAGTWRHRRKDGGLMDVEVKLHSLEFMGHAAALAVAQDITDRLRAERALRESEERYRAVADTATDGIFIVDDRGLNLYANRAAERIFGYTLREMVGTAVTRLMPGFRDHSREGCFAGESPRDPALLESVPLEGLHKSGRRLPLEVSFGEFRREERTYFTGVVRDVSARQQAQEAARASEARFAALVRNATYGIFHATMEGKFLDVNPALVRMLGYESEEALMGSRSLDSIYGDPQACARLKEAYLTVGRVDGVETAWRRKDGSEITVRLSGRALPDAQGVAASNEVIVEDVTERRAMERHLRQVQKFEAIGQLAGGIAHDFNNVIGAILGWADLGQDLAPADTPASGYFRKIRDQADRAAALTRQLLAFARRQILEPRHLSLNQTVQDLESLLEKVIGKDIEVRTRLAGDLALIHADPTQIEQVMMNLCLNARDAMPGGGCLTIGTGNVEFPESECARLMLPAPGRYVELAVEDTGMGMDAATRERIFEPFFTTKGAGKGTGLGLATVYGIVKQHGGAILVESEPGNGTSFRVYLPVASPAGQPVRGTGEIFDAPPRGGRETILLAEDHDGMREMARATLQGLGYRVILAEDGQQAVEVFSRHREEIDLILLDVVMPKLNGSAVHARVISLRPEIPVIFSTGYSAEADELTEKVQRGMPILQKPYTSAALGRKVREVLDRARSGQPTAPLPASPPTLQ